MESQSDYLNEAQIALSQYRNVVSEHPEIIQPDDKDLLALLIEDAKYLNAKLNP